jgi:hypothetical protein
VDGLEGCPNLDRLWLHSNRITDARGVAPCTHLRELWVQMNEIVDLGAFRSLAHLQTLALAGNPIEQLHQLEPLAHLSALAELSFQDPLFDTSSIIDQAGYRELVVRRLPQVRVLDGCAIHGSERHDVEDAYLRRAIDFNDQIERLRQAGAVRKADLARRREVATAAAARVQV